MLARKKQCKIPSTIFNVISQIRMHLKIDCPLSSTLWFSQGEHNLSLWPIFLIQIDKLYSTVAILQMILSYMFGTNGRKRMTKLQNLRVKILWSPNEGLHEFPGLSDLLIILKWFSQKTFHASGPSYVFWTEALKDRNAQSWRPGLLEEGSGGHCFVSIATFFFSLCILNWAPFTVDKEECCLFVWDFNLFIFVICTIYADEVLFPCRLHKPGFAHVEF